MKWKDRNEHEKIDVIGEIVITGGFSIAILAVLIQFARALLHG